MTLEILDDDPTWEDEGPPRRRGRGALGLLVVLLLLAAAYVGVALWFGDRVPRGTTVSGVPVGGRTADEAREALTAGLAERTGGPVTLSSPVGQAQVPAADLGLAVDVDATVDGLTGFSLSPERLWQHATGAAVERAVVTVDEQAFSAALESARARLDAAPVEGTLSVAAGTVAYTAPKDGSRTDEAGTLEAVQRWWPEEDGVEVAAERLSPKVSAEEWQSVRTEFADVAVSGPVSVKAGGKTFSLSPKEFGPAVVLTPAADGSITPEADPEKLTAAVRAAAKRAGAEVEAKPARVTFSGRTPSVAPHVTGVALEEESLRTEVWRAITTRQRTATVAVRATEPAFTTAKARATLPKGLISTFTTYFQPGQARVSNIKLASRVLSGTYVLPGEQFSMNAVLGERTAAKGYVEAGIIRNGRAAESVGGGISQVSTTIFNAAFFSGMRLDEWTPHYYYISRYPEGREATISWPDLHNKFTNTTAGGVLMELTTTDRSITVNFYGTKTWDIEATKSPRRNIVQPKTYTDDDPECINQAPVVGFTVDVGRIFTQGGKVVKRETYTTTYRPEDDVTCTNPAAG